MSGKIWKCTFTLRTFRGTCSFFYLRASAGSEVKPFHIAVWDSLRPFVVPHNFTSNRFFFKSKFVTCHLRHLLVGPPQTDGAEVVKTRIFQSVWCSRCVRWILYASEILHNMSVKHLSACLSVLSVCIHNTSFSVVSNGDVQLATVVLTSPTYGNPNHLCSWSEHGE